MDNCIVVSRYSENLDWINELLENTWICKVIVYNKGSDDIHFDNEKVEIIKIPNIGREGETYLRYIIDNYDTLPARVWFTQGNPFEHSPDYLGLMKKSSVEKYDPEFQSLSQYWKKDFHLKHNHDPVASNINGYGFKLYRISSKTYQLKDPEYFFDEGVNYLVKEFTKNYGPDPSKEFFKKIGIKRPRGDIDFCFSAIFSVTRESIKRNSRESYVLLKQELIRFNEHGGSNGYALERLWCYLFTHKCFTVKRNNLAIFLDGSVLRGGDLFRIDRTYDINVNYRGKSPKELNYLQTHTEYVSEIDTPNIIEVFSDIVKHVPWRQYQYIIVLDRYNNQDLDDIFITAESKGADIVTMESRSINILGIHNGAYYNVGETLFKKNTFKKTVHLLNTYNKSILEFNRKKQPLHIVKKNSLPICFQIVLSLFLKKDSIKVLNLSPNNPIAEKTDLITKIYLFFRLKKIIKNILTVR